MSLQLKENFPVGESFILVFFFLNCISEELFFEWLLNFKQFVKLLKDERVLMTGTPIRSSFKFLKQKKRSTEENRRGFEEAKTEEIEA
jgi:hypothetical protein